MNDVWNRSNNEHLLKMMLYSWRQLGALGGISLVYAIVSITRAPSVLRSENTSVFWLSHNNITVSYRPQNLHNSRSRNNTYMSHWLNHTLVLSALAITTSNSLLSPVTHIRGRMLLAMSVSVSLCVTSREHARLVWKLRNQSTQKFMTMLSQCIGCSIMTSSQIQDGAKFTNTILKIVYHHISVKRHQTLMKFVRRSWLGQQQRSCDQNFKTFGR